MHRRLTRAERLLTRFELAIALMLVLGCSSVELVGVDKATVLRADARTNEPAVDASAQDASALDTSARDASALDASAQDSGAVDAATARAHDAAGTPDGGALVVFSDPSRPAPFPGQFLAPSSSCPATEPSAGASCATEGQQCDYPVCWGRGNRSWVCLDHRYTVWFDESFLCASARPCPAEAPRQGAVCSLQIECVYPYFCCKGPTGFLPALCDGQWNLGQPECAGCVAPP